ncbi:MAG: glycosyltransferase family 61 protein, partial [Crocinitomicaceae bacterium]|nr:glycosyltransferase family 61 protein [Crocinitomicaceae bacterium]
LYIDQQSKYDKIYTSGTPILYSLFEMIQVKFKKIHFVEQQKEELIMDCADVEIQNWPAYHKRNINKTRLIKQAIDEFIKNNIKTEVNNRLIYCTRNTSSDAKHGRMMNHENEKEIVELLKKYCDENHLLFTMFNGQEDGKTMSHIKQLKLFNEAKIVVGPHGSAMANVIYLNPKNKPRVCEFTSGTETQIHGSAFDKHYNFLFGYLFDEIYDYNLIPFDKSSTSEFTSIDVDNLRGFIKRVSA